MFFMNSKGLGMGHHLVYLVQWCVCTLSGYESKNITNRAMLMCVYVCVYEVEVGRLEQFLVTLYTSMLFVLVHVTFQV